MREDKAITMILSNLTWYRADEVLPDKYPEDIEFWAWYNTPHTYLCIDHRGDADTYNWFNGWNKSPGQAAETELDTIVLWAEMPNGKDLLKEVSPNDDM